MPETIDWPSHGKPRSIAPCCLSLSRRLSSSSSLAAALPSPTGSTCSGSARSGYTSVFWKTLRPGVGNLCRLCRTHVPHSLSAFLALRHSHAADLPGNAYHHIRWPAHRVSRGEGTLWHIALVAAVIIALVTGFAMKAQWPTLALYWYAPQAAQVPIPSSAAARLLSLHASGLAADRRLAAYAGRAGCVLAVLFLVAAGGGRALERHVQRAFPALARRFRCCWAFCCSPSPSMNTSAASSCSSSTTPSSTA